MPKEEGKNESRKLAGGEIVYLLKEPGANWQIRSYECRQNVIFINAAEGFFFEWLQGLPKDWKGREFDSVDSAIEFVKQQIKEEKVPRNDPKAILK
jgi:hypothetical protein